MSHDPQLVSAAVHSLCDRDPVDMQACQRMTHFSPRVHSSTMAGVKFTRCLYAQLLHQRFSCPRNSGFNVPPAGNQHHTACDLGMKLVSLSIHDVVVSMPSYICTAMMKTCGLEILISRVKGGATKVRLGESRTYESVEGDPRWVKFLKSLDSKGFFKNELEGSRLYNQLVSSAKEYFVNHLQDEDEDPQL